MEAGVMGAHFEACRVCANLYLTTSEIDFIDFLHPIEGLEHEVGFIVSLLKAWEIKIEPDDGLPHRLCDNCFAKFCSIHGFQKECQDAQVRLLQSFGIECNSSDQYDAQTEQNMNELVSAVSSVGQETQIETDVDAQIQLDTYSAFEQTDVVNDGTDILMENETTSDMSFIPTLSGEEFFAEQTSNVAVAQDIEDVLQGNVIPKSLSNAEKQNEDEGEDEAGYGYETSVPFGHIFDPARADDLDGSAPLSNNPFACQYCYYEPECSIEHLVFPNAEALSQHLFAVHDPNQPYTCPHCALTYKSIKLRDNHVQIQHRRTRQAEKCAYCGKALRSSPESHENICTFVGDWECEFCNVKLIQKPLNRFRAHQRLHKVQKQYNCNICDKVFTRRSNLEAHEKVHALLGDESVLCDICSTGFENEYALKRHKYLVHNGELPVKCDYCFKGFVSRAFLSRHLEHFHPEKVDAATCSDCGAKFSSLHKLRFHMQRPRDENGQCVDAACGIKEKRTQTRKYNFPCSYCSKRYYNKIQLDRHLTMHDPEERPYQCKHCHIRCRTTSELDQHNKITHSNTFECTVCCKSFGYKRDLRDHMLYHTELPVYCTEANCEFTCKNDRILNDHIRQKHHLIPCEYCGATFTQHRLIKHLNEVHRAEIDVDIMETQSKEITESIPTTTSSSLPTITGPNKVLVEYVGGEAMKPVEELTEDQPSNAYTVIATGDAQLDDFFLGSLIDPDNEIIVT